jgi:cytochrome c5
VFRKPLLMTLIAIAVLEPFAARAQQKLSLKSVSVDLPFGGMFPDGPGSDLLNNNCLACHSAGMVLNQPTMSKAQWHAEVEKMRTAYKAPIDPKDVDPIADYLVQLGQRSK